jgi:hypothetical protein
VPNTEPEPDERPQGKPQLFERSDFDELFNPPGVQEQPISLPADAQPSPVAAGAGAPVGAWEPKSEPAFDVESLVMQPPPAVKARTGGIVLSPTMATVLTVLMIVALALAFGAGLLVGRALGT